MTDDPGAVAPLPSLSVIVPVYNAASWVAPTVGHIRTALAAANWSRSEIVLVDDGSTDGTAAAIADLPEGDVPVVVVTTANQGRFLARQEGLDVATGEFAFLVDIRVFVDEHALVFLANQLRRHPDRRVWNGHTRTATSWKPWTRFWNPLTFVAWRRYLGSPTTTSFGLDDYDHYPKGTGFFFAPRQQMLDLCAVFDTAYDDVSKASDDTLLIKPLAASDRINISPDFGGVYFPREGLADFFRHSYFRGTTFVDGHLRPGSRFNRIFWSAVPAGAVALLVALRRPRPTATVAAVALGTAPLAGRAIGIPMADGASFAVLAPAFAVAYGGGIVRGFVLRLRARSTDVQAERSCATTSASGSR